MSNDAQQTVLKDSPGEIEAEFVSLASDTGGRSGQIWVNPQTHEILSGPEADANAKLRHYFTDIDEALLKWGAFGTDKKVHAKVRVILRKVEATLGSKIEELFFLDTKSYVAVTTVDSNHAGVAWIHRGQINTRVEIKGSLPTESKGKTFYYTALPAVSAGRIVIKETPAPAHRTCMTCGSPVPPTLSCEWCPE
ncbi:unannotated protein [freshwater metagenome]|uniref:Unannotated protein n=1 Tax=freshwater metagenome TaxID=449393 RepID=A0A6J6GW54_9ZZZZ|nr:hypothetical protein [Actinomycetota bacterium]